jgi:hypothetical protein
VTRGDPPLDKPTGAAFFAWLCEVVPEAARFCPDKVVDRECESRECCPEAEAEDGTILIYPPFWQGDERRQIFIFCHELGHHALDRVGRERVQRWLDAMLPDWRELGLPYGCESFHEAFADCFAIYLTEPHVLGFQSEEWNDLVERVMRAYR